MVNTSTGSAKRFGVRYGARNRVKVATAEAQYRGKVKCPFCNKYTIKRVAAGIFKCTKDGQVFAGRAYSINKSDVTE